MKVRYLITYLSEIPDTHLLQRFKSDSTKAYQMQPWVLLEANICF